MSIANKTLKSLLSKFKMGVDLTAVIDALSLSFERLVQFFRNVIKESNAGTAIDTLEDWYTQLEINYDPSKLIKELQHRAKQVHTSTGGCSIGYLNEQLQIAYPDVFIQEVFIDPEFQAGFGMAGLMMASNYPAWLTPAPTDGTYPNFFYQVLGEVDSTFDLFGIQNLLDHVMPAPYQPIYTVTIRNLTPTAKAGLGMSGLMMAGRVE
jgi:uncharacterized protein YmfQ (DUF2313 family)